MKKDLRKFIKEKEKMKKLLETTRLDKLSSFLLFTAKSKFDIDCSNVQLYRTIGDEADNRIVVYKKDGIEVYYCSEWDYLEILGLDDKEYNDFIQIIAHNNIKWSK